MHYLLLSDKSSQNKFQTNALAESTNSGQALELTVQQTIHPTQLLHHAADGYSSHTTTSTEQNDTYLTDESFTSNSQAAILWHNFDLNVIPLVPHSKQTAVTWDSWLKDLSVEKITNYWQLNSEYELGFIVGDDLIVLDADSPQSLAAIYQIENAFGITSNLIVKTTKGEHHYFKRAKGTFAKSDSHDTEKYPVRIDVKTGRSMVILPPSTGKEIEVCDAVNAGDLTEVDQDFIDAIFRHNGRSEPRSQKLVIPSISSENQTLAVKKLTPMLAKLDADLGYEDWLHVGMAIYHETGGSYDGFELFNSWSSNGSKYKGVSEITTKWNSFKPGSANPITIKTIYRVLCDQGIDWTDDDDEFRVCDDDELKIYADAVTPLIKFSLRGQSELLETNLQNEVLIFGKIAVLGQLTSIYAEYNSGKTVVMFHLIVKAIDEGLIDPEKLFYCNMDDSLQGVLDKNYLAEEYGFHLLSQGYMGFTSKKLLVVILELIDTNQASGVIVILDTLKKFADLMNKKDASYFANVMRQFSLKGGTVIALAHTNKYKDADGKSIYGGTSDIIADFDATYVVDVVSNEIGIKTIEFSRKKGRGKIAESVAYRYKSDDTTSWSEILCSVEEVDPFELPALKQAAKQKADAEIVDAVKACIREGINQKMKLVKASAKSAGVSQATACRIIEKYTGESPYWQFTVGPKGAKVFSLFE
jgi:archaellum biogenesis ATPase FlaH